MTIEVRPTSPSEFRRASEVLTTALMVAPPSDERWAEIEPGWVDMTSFSAWDAEQCVGHAAHQIVDTTVPGGRRLPTGAIARVGVATTHRRRGIATELMRAVIEDGRDRGAAMMSLRASEATIYARYGFGVAGELASLEIDPRRARPVGGQPTPGRFRLLEPDQIEPTIEPLYDRIAHRRPGVISRPVRWQRRLLSAAITRSTASFVAVHEGSDGPDGFVHYTVNWIDSEGMASGGAGQVHDLWGADDAIELALWRFVLDVDLVTTWTARDRPVDDPIRHAVHDCRAVRTVAVRDEQWLRLVDVDAALRGRTYHPATGSIVVAVRDDLFGDNTGSWRIGTDGVTRTEEPADLVTNIATLSALYLGGPSWAELAAAGHVATGRPETINVADELFRAHRAPFCGTFF